mmetsp:Transcript_1981/g.2231  ORF Transcript_1981/g.2231 Transcript_1981/m.2231 type:complete len:135 (+) Transcript_1981:168-572(+)
MIRPLSLFSSISLLVGMLLLSSSVHSFSPVQSPNVKNKISFGQSFLTQMSDNDTAESVEEIPPQPVVRCPDCDKCDGTGRILGGIPRILPWWPIKPYRPCPNFIANGGQYTRIGQPLDEIAFGRGNLDMEDDDF